jgi:hypothetical protein
VSEYRHGVHEELTALSEAIDHLTPSERLRLAAALVDAGRDELAETLARRAIETLAERHQVGPPPWPALDLSNAEAAALGRMFRRAQGHACNRMVRPPDWSPARDLEICGTCRASLLQHAARVAADAIDAIAHDARISS